MPEPKLLKCPTSGLCFTIFASNDEGYGLPIAESLAHGVPCLTANFGAMAEVATGGGCLTCNVNDPEKLTEAIRTLHEDRAMRRKLRHEISNRQFRDWKIYCQDVANILASYDEPLMEVSRVLKEIVTVDGPVIHRHH